MFHIAQFPNPEGTFRWFPVTCTTLCARTHRVRRNTLACKLKHHISQRKMKTKQSVGRRQKIVSEYPRSSRLCFLQIFPPRNPRGLLSCAAPATGAGAINSRCVLLAPRERGPPSPSRSGSVPASLATVSPHAVLLAAARGRPTPDQAASAPGRVGWLAAARREVAPRGAEQLPAAPARSPLSGNRIQRAPGYAARLGLLPH